MRRLPLEDLIYPAVVACAVPSGLFSLGFALVIGCSDGKTIGITIMSASGSFLACLLVFAK